MEGNNMTVSLKLAKFARKLGFDGVTSFAYCFDTGNKSYYINYDPDYFLNSKLWEKHYAAPSREQLHAWLMEKGIFVTVEVDQTMEPKFCYHIAVIDYKTNIWTNYDPSGTALFYKYVEALEEGLEEGLKLL
jgi:hypothetical protein